MDGTRKTLFLAALIPAAASLVALLLWPVALLVMGFIASMASTEGGANTFAQELGILTACLTLVGLVSCPVAGIASGWGKSRT